MFKTIFMVNILNHVIIVQFYNFNKWLLFYIASNIDLIHCN